MKEQPDITPKKSSFLVRLIALLVTAVLLLGALVLVVYREELNLDALARWYAYRTLETSASGEAAPFSHAGGDQISFACLDSGLLMASDSGVRYYSFSGELYAQEVSSLEHPVLAASGAYGVAYSAGGDDVYVFQGVEEVFHLDLEGEGRVLSARVNSAGWLAVTTQGGGHRGTVTVYDSTYRQAVIQIGLSDYIVDAAVSPDCGTVALVTLGQEGGAFQSQVLFYPVDQKEPSAVGGLGNAIVLDLDYEDGLLWVLGEDQVLTVAEDGTVSGSYAFGQRYLKGCSFGGEGFALLLLGRYQAGGAEEAVLLAPDGAEQASLSFASNVLDFGAAGRYIALLTGDALSLYLPDFSLYSALDHTQHARHLALSSSGAVLLANAQQAWMYLPE